MKSIYLYLDSPQPSTAATRNFPREMVMNIRRGEGGGGGQIEILCGDILKARVVTPARESP